MRKQSEDAHIELSQPPASASAMSHVSGAKTALPLPAAPCIAMLAQGAARLAGPLRPSHFVFFGTAMPGNQVGPHPRIERVTQAAWGPRLGDQGTCFSCAVP